ncbi:MAG: glycosyltransferase family 4 protein [Opitutaceae bacterium]
MNIWICIAYDPLPRIDSTTRLLRYGTLAQQLAGAGHSVVFWTSTFDHWRKQQRFNSDHAEVIDSKFRIELLHSPGYRRNISWARVRHNRTLARRFMERAASFEKPDIIFAGIPCLELTEAAANYAKFHRVPFNVDIQDIWPEVYVSVLPRALRFVGRAALHSEFARTRRILRGAQAITAVSQEYLAWARKLRDAPGPNDGVFHLGYPLPDESVLASARARAPEFLARFAIPADRILATFLGQFAASYDIDTLIDAARKLDGSPSNVHFVLAGNGDKFARAQRRARGIRSLTLTGWLERNDTITLLQQSHIGLAAYSRRAPQSLPYKPFEYMAHGLPIVCSLRGELKALITDHAVGRYYVAGDANSLAEAIQRLAGDANCRGKAGLQARALFNRQFDASAITERLIAHLNRLAGGTN